MKPLLLLTSLCFGLSVLLFGAPVQAQPCIPYPDCTVTQNPTLVPTLFAMTLTTIASQTPAPPTLNFSAPTIPWATPTAIPVIPATSVVQINYAPVEIAESIVQGYQQTRNTDLMLAFQFVLIFLIIAGGIWSIARHAKSL